LSRWERRKRKEMRRDEKKGKREGRKGRAKKRTEEEENRRKRREPLGVFLSLLAGRSNPEKDPIDATRAPDLGQAKARSRGLGARFRGRLS
jgi:hypothetical protein